MIEYGLNLDTYNNYRTQSKFASKRAISWPLPEDSRYFLHYKVPAIIYLEYVRRQQKSSIKAIFDTALFLIY